MELARGKKIGTQLVLVEPIAGGAMGTVWVAEHTTLRTQVAVKLVDPALVSKDPAAVERFRHEASASARIKSPHVVQVFDHDFTDDGRPYIVMELIEGETLKQRLERGALSPTETGHVVLHVSRALARAHDKGIIHRDVKPENIFISETADGEMFCKVFDFGIAKQVELPELDGLTNPGLLVGTPEFMSPEIFSNKRDIDRYADLWALAVVAYYALARKLPFPGENVGELCTNLLTTDPTPISALRSDVPAALDAWFSRALAKDPEQRFAGARELAKSFVAAVQLGDPLRLSSPDLTEAARMFSTQPPAIDKRSLSHTSSTPFIVDSTRRVGVEDRAGRSRMVVAAAVVAIAALGVVTAVVALRQDRGTATSPAGASPAPRPTHDAATAEPARASEPSIAPKTDPSEQSPVPSASASVALRTETAAKPPAAPASSAMPGQPKPMPRPRGSHDWAF